jgi:hypothetical protein
MRAALMDFSHLITEAYRITRQNKVLWIFGVIAAIFGGFPNVFNFTFNLPSGFPGSDGKDTSTEEFSSSLGFISHIDSSVWLVIIALAVVVILTIVLVALYFQTWAYAGLVSQTLNVIKGKSVTFKGGKEVGEKFFWRIVGFRFLFGLAVVPILVVFVAIPVLFFMAGLNAFAVAFIIIEVMLFMLGIIVYSVAVGIISEFGLRKMLEGDLKIVESIKEGWYLFRNNVSSSLLVWLVSMALGFVLIFPVVFISIFLLVFGVAFFIINPWLAVIPAVFFIAALAFVGGLWNVFAVSYWSLAYKQLLEKGGVANAARTDATTNNSAG